MRCPRIVGLAALGLMAFGPRPADAGPDGTGPASKLSAALGGSLDSDLGEAGALAHPVDYSTITLFPGRAVEYRRRVALEMQLDSRSTLAAHRSAMTRAPSKASPTID